jgi:hAT family C-terminal dimerisation region
MKTDMSPIYAAALVLNPAYRKRYIETHWPKKWAKPTLASVKKLWERYRDEGTSMPLETLPLSHDYTSQKSTQEPTEPDAFDRIASILRSFARPSSGDEYVDYNSEDSFDPGEEGAHVWWCKDTQMQRWPKLSRMAIDILSIPPMSDEPERVFSGARRTVSWDRGQLKPETIEMRECLKHWKKSKILDNFIQELD